MAFKKHASEVVAKNDGRCEWNADNMRCKYPGTFSFSTLGNGPWYCTFHAAPIDPITAGEIVAESQSYVSETLEYRKQEAQLAANAYCKRIGLVRKDGEGASEFHERRRQFFREKLKGFLRHSTEEKAAA